MKREKEVPLSVIKHIKASKDRYKTALSNLDIFCTLPERAVKMRVLEDMHGKRDRYATVIIPSVDIYVSNNPFLRDGYVKRDSLSYFVHGTKKVFPYGHVYASSGYICLGNIFVPSAVPVHSPAMPLETLFLHNDRNLSHGNSHLVLTGQAEQAVSAIIASEHIKLSELSKRMTAGTDVIANDEIWNMSADVVQQTDLPKALDIMCRIYGAVFGQEMQHAQDA
jgi:hypothetical protein